MTAYRERKKLLIPKEHGVWAMMYVPFIIGVWLAGGFRLATLLLFIAITSGYCARTPFMTLFRSWQTQKEEVNRAMFWLLGYVVLTIGTFAILFVRMQSVSFIILFLSAAVFFIAHSYLTIRRFHRTVWGEIFGVIGLTLTAPLGYYSVLRQIDEMALILWFLNALFFSSSIFYVKLWVATHGQTKKPRFWGSLLLRRINASNRRQATLYRNYIYYHLFLLVTIGVLLAFKLVPLLIFPVFSPIFVRMLIVISSLDKKLNIKQIGFAELGYSISFALLMVVVFLATG